MDNVWKQNRFSDYFLTMANLQSQELYRMATHVGLLNIKDGFVRMAFEDEVRAFIDHQIKTIRLARSEAECQACIQNLKQERENLSLQDRMLRSGEAVVHAAIEFIKRDDVQGYIINGVGIVLSGVQVVAGLGL